MRSRGFVSSILRVLSLGALAGCAGPNVPTAEGPEGLYLQHCAKCHARAGEPGGPQRGGSKGPDLKHIGSAKGIDADWLTDYIRDPKSRRPDAKLMPAFGDKMSEAEIRSLAEWLAAKK
jgi:mono/diheme cytochrome c family protein